MTRQKLSLCPAALVSLLLSASLAVAQPAPGRGRPDNAQPDPKAYSPAKQGGTVTLKFPGGTVREYVDMVRKNAVDVYVNVSFTDSVEKLEMPSIEFTGVFVGTALEAVTQMVAPHAEQTVKVRELRGGSGIPGETLYILGLVSNNPLGTTPGPKMVVFSLNDLIGPAWIAHQPNDGTIAAETILTAVETAARTAQAEAPPPDIRFHKESGMLLLRGSREQLEAAHEVFAHLHDDINSRRIMENSQRQAERQNETSHSAMQQLQAEVAQRSEQAQKAESDARTLSREIAKHEAAVEMLRHELDKRSEEMAKLAEDRRHAQDRIAELERIVDQYKAQYGDHKGNPPK